MSKVIPGIQGVPMRKIVKKEINSHGYWVETLACGHTRLETERSFNSHRRCYACKRERESREK